MSAASRPTNQTVTALRCASASATTANKAATAKPRAAQTVQSTTPAQPQGARTKMIPARIITACSRPVYFGREDLRMVEEPAEAARTQRG